jgi:nicotinamide-nucleotide amidase
MTSTTHTHAAALGELLLRNSWTITTAESCTGGGVAQAITAISGSSAYFHSAVVTYSNAAKTKFLGVPADTLAACGAVSEQTVYAMAHGAAELADADCAIAISGIAGPTGGSIDKPVGTVWFAFRYPVAVASSPSTTGSFECSVASAVSYTPHTVCKCILFQGDRDAVRQQAVEYALQTLCELLTVSSHSTTV